MFEKEGLEMQVVIFGTGYQGMSYYLDTNDEVVAFADNSKEKQGKYVFDIPVISAEGLLRIRYDKICIASEYYYKEIKQQLLSLGIEESKIFLWKDADWMRGTEQREVVRAITQIVCEDSFQQKTDEYEKRWKRLLKQYKTIRIIRLTVCNLGETVFRANWIKHVIDFDDQNVLTVTIPDAIYPAEVDSWYSVCNWMLLRHLGGTINLVLGEEALFWSYVVSKHPESLDLTDSKRFWNRSKETPNFSVKAYSEGFRFEKDEVQKGEDRIREMGLQEPFICIATRTSDYHREHFGSDATGEGRNVSIEIYDKTLTFLREKGYMAVRMGREKPLKHPIDNCVDYSGFWGDEFLDWYIASKCSFFVTTDSGIFALGELSHRPLIIFNVASNLLGASGFEYTPYDIYLPRKLFSKKENRFLSLWESLPFEKELYFRFTRENCEEMGVEVVMNTSDEVRDAVEEMMLRLEGKWEDTPEDIMNYKRYEEIQRKRIEWMEKQYDMSWKFGPAPQRLSTTYLRTNQYLLN